MSSTEDNWREFWGYVGLFLGCTCIVEVFYVVIFVYNWKRTQPEPRRRRYSQDFDDALELDGRSAEQAVPRHWEPFDITDNGFKIFPLDKNHKDFRSISVLFETTMPRTKYKIERIEKIQNKIAWGKFRDCRRRMEENNDGLTNEKKLFHGTRNVKPEEIYKNETGFDMRYSNQGMWGTGNYFAVNASYSDSYAHTLGNGAKQMLVAIVLAGYVYKCEADRNLRKPPKRVDSPGAVGRLYDSVSGNTMGSDVYITYDNDRAYPAYLITYRGSV